MSTEITSTILPLLPLDDGVILPNMAIAIAITSDEARAAFDDALATDGPPRLVIATRRNGQFSPIGVVAELDGQPAMLPGGHRGATIRALHRAELGQGQGEGIGGALRIAVTEHPDPDEVSEHAHELAREYRIVIEEILEARGASGIVAFLRTIDHPGALADTAGYSPDLSLERKIELLETLDVEVRLERALSWARDTLAEIELRRKIRDDVAEDMDKSQREYVLRRQLEAIRKELGDEDGSDDAERYGERIAETPLSDEARKEAERELKRLESTGPGHPEASTIRTYLDWLLSLPWGKESDDQDDVAAAGAVLEADHAGLDEVKDRILEYLAVRSFRRKREIEDEGGGAILCLVGPPGVGKTSLGESIARALGREFVRMSLGGIRDEAEIRGHRRTYIGALPGRLVRALRDAGTMNPVILLDEVDKLGADWRGDPSSALLEVLDPAQNSTFRDHYLDLKVDLSKVLFIATANLAEQIPEALLDRLEVIRIDGYTEDEKVTIAHRYLVPRAERRNGLEPGEVVIEDEALRRVVTEYTREAGVRNVERLIQKVLRKSAKKLAEGVETPITVVAGDLRELLGRPRPDVDMARRESVAGVATGLAVTGSGGDVLVVEATEMAGKGLTLTGQLGDVMSESATIALSYVRSHGDVLGIDVAALAEREVHIHVPAGAIPKDGPSAGVTMTVALVSLISGRAVRADVGMTGEVTLQGRVLPVGGIKQKVLAAHRAGLTDVILPSRNGGDLDELPQSVLEAVRFHLVDHVDEALAVALEPAPAAIV
ncbi:MAG: ATP-dependent Lon protease [Gaiellales bacterium]|nr:ATP-dependent Lon protease [Gaiellales bacterium]